MKILRGRLVAFSCRAIKAEARVRRGGAPEPEVNDEDEQLGLMRDRMDNLAESASLVLDLHDANDELWKEHLELWGPSVTLELSGVRES